MSDRARTAFLLTFLLLGGRAIVHAEKTDVVVLRNGDRITCTIKEVRSGRLRVSTDHLGTVYVEWLEVASITSLDNFEVELNTGDRYIGRFESTSDPRRLAVVSEFARTELDLEHVVKVKPLGQKFWSRLDGSFDLGFSFTQAESQSQFNLNSEVNYRRPAKTTGLSLSGSFSTRENSPSTQRADLSFTHLRSLKPKLFIGVFGQAQHNEELGLDLRTLGSVAAGRDFVESNRSTLRGLAGLAVSREWPQDQGGQENLELFLAAMYQFFTYDYPNTDLQLQIAAFPSLTQSSRVRVEAQFSVKRELVKDLYFSVSAYESFDSDPLAEGVENNDYGISTSLGWSF